MSPIGKIASIGSGSGLAQKRREAIIRTNVNKDLKPYGITWGLFQYKDVFRPSYLHSGNSYTGKMSSLYWIGGQVTLN